MEGHALARAVRAALLLFAVVTLCSACSGKDDEQVAQLQAQVEQWQEKCESVTARNEALQREVAALKEERENLAAERDALKERVPAADEVGGLRKELAQQRERVEQLAGQLAQLRQRQPGEGETEESASAEDVRKRLKQARERMEQLAGILFERDELNVARSLALTAFQLGSAAPETLYQVAYCEAAAGNYETSADWYARLLKALDSRAEPDQELLKKSLNNYGVVLAELGKPDAAARQYIRALALDDAYAPAYFNLGLLQASELNQPEEAIQALRKHIIHGGRRAFSARDLILKLQDRETEKEPQGEAPE